GGARGALADVSAGGVHAGRVGAAGGASAGSALVHVDAAVGNGIERARAVARGVCGVVVAERRAGVAARATHPGREGRAVADLARVDGAVAAGAERAAPRAHAEDAGLAHVAAVDQHRDVAGAGAGQRDGVAGAVVEARRRGGSAEPAGASGRVARRPRQLRVPELHVHAARAGGRAADGVRHGENDLEARRLRAIEAVARVVTDDVLPRDHDEI